MKVLILYSRLTTYWLACMRQAYAAYGIIFLVYRKAPSSEAPFYLADEEGITIRNSDAVQEKSERDLMVSFSPDCLYVSGWNNKNYLRIAKAFKAKGVPVICGMDNHWQGSAKQQFAAAFARIYLARFLDYLWVPGAWQFHYALKLGFPKEKILSGLYAADVNAFLTADILFKKRFLFVGRLVHHKGIDLLLDAFREVSSTLPDWELLIVGNGDAEITAKIKSSARTTHFPFMDSRQLATLMHEGGVLVLPSRYEAWGVVVHEAVASGMLVIASTECGATSSFVKEYYNGFLVKPNKHALGMALQKAGSLDIMQYNKMASRSRELALCITPELWAAQLFAVLNK